MYGLDHLYRACMQSPGERQAHDCYITADTAVQSRKYSTVPRPFLTSGGVWVYIFLSKNWLVRCICMYTSPYTPLWLKLLDLYQPFQFNSMSFWGVIPWRIVAMFFWLRYIPRALLNSSRARALHTSVLCVATYPSSTIYYTVTHYVHQNIKLHLFLSCWQLCIRRTERLLNCDHYILS